MASQVGKSKVRNQVNLYLPTNLALRIADIQEKALQLTGATLNLSAIFQETVVPYLDVLERRLNQLESSEKND